MACVAVVTATHATTSSHEAKSIFLCRVKGSTIELLKRFQVVHKGFLALAWLLFQFFKHLQRKGLSAQLFPVFAQPGVKCGASHAGKLKLALLTLYVRAMPDEVLPATGIGNKVDATTMPALLVLVDDRFSSIHLCSPFLLAAILQEIGAEPPDAPPGSEIRVYSAGDLPQKDRESTPASHSQ